MIDFLEGGPFTLEELLGSLANASFQAEISKQHTLHYQQQGDNRAVLSHHADRCRSETNVEMGLRLLTEDELKTLLGACDRLRLMTELRLRNS